MLGRYDPNSRGRQTRGGNRPNPFELMDNHMSQMMSGMDSAFGGRHGSMMDQMMGFDNRRGGSMMDQMMGGGLASMMGGMGGANGTSCQYSSCSYSSCSGGGGPAVEYSSTSHGIRRPGEDMVHETHRNYRDSSGNERLGVSRHIGNRCAGSPPGGSSRAAHVLSSSELPPLTRMVCTSQWSLCRCRAQRRRPRDAHR